MKEKPEIKKVLVEITLHSGIVVFGELIPYDNIANDDKPLTLNPVTVKQNTPFYSKIYKSNDFVLSSKKTSTGCPIPFYKSHDFTLVLKRSHTFATIFPITIKTLTYL